MKKALNLLVALLAMTTFSCDDDIFQDYNPVSIYVTVTDTNGNNLLDPNYEKNIIDGITVTYDGETSQVKNPFSDVKGKIKTDALLALYKGAELRYYTDAGKTVYYISIGEWAGDKTWNNEEVHINWPDGTSNIISFTLKKKGITHTKYYLDGVRHTGSTFDFTK